MNDNSARCMLYSKKGVYQTAGRQKKAFGARVLLKKLKKGVSAAIIDCYSRSVPACELYNLLEGSFCISALERLVQRSAVVTVQTKTVIKQRFQNREKNWKKGLTNEKKLHLINSYNL